MSALDLIPLHGGDSDQTLVRRIRKDGDDDAALRLYLKYSERLLRSTERNMSDALSSRLDPEDVVQSVFRTFFRRTSEGQYQVPEGEELWKLLLVMSLNKVRSVGKFHRAAKRNICSSSSLAADDAIGLQSRDEFSRAILELSINEIISELPESARRIIALRIEGFEVAQISEMTSRAKRTVERVLQNFRAEMTRRSEDWQ